MTLPHESQKKQLVSKHVDPLLATDETEVVLHNNREKPDSSSVETAPVRVVDKRWWARDKVASDEHNESRQPTYVAELEQRIAEQENRLDELRRKHDKVGRDFEQTRDRQKREFSKNVARETRRVLFSFLDVVDNLDRAIVAAEQEGAESTATILQGVQLVRQQLLETFKRYDVRRLDADNQSFDPDHHDALSTVRVSNPESDNVVVTVVKPGYLVGDDVLRPASVVVGKYQE